MMKRTKRGSYIVEAALVLPVVIMVTITSVLIIMFYFSQTVEQSRLHMALRSKAGMLTESTAYADHTERLSDTDAEIYEKKKAMGGEVYGKKYLVMAHKGTLEKKGTFTVEGACHAADGVSYVRYCSMGKDVADEAE